MEYRKLGNSDITVSSIAFGAWAAGGWKWGGTDDEASVAAMHAAFDAGITTIDTAPIYGMGHSETVVGRAIQGRRDKVVLATKCGLRWDLDHGATNARKATDADGKEICIQNCLRPESVRHEVEQSLRRLGTDYIDLYQCHAPDPDTPVEDTMAELNKLLDEGKVRAIGVSNFSADLMARAHAAAPIVSSQSMYNLVLRETEQEVAPFCANHGMSIVAYTPLLLGLLTGKVSMEREFPEGDLRRDHHLFTPEYRQRILRLIENYQPIAERHGVTPAQLAIAWVAAQPTVATVLAGARNVDQARENAEAGQVQLTQQEQEQMADLAREHAAV